MHKTLPKISVICALYIGNRPVQVHNLKYDKLYYFGKQLEYLDRYKDKIDKFYFVTTFQDSEQESLYQPILQKYSNEQVQIIVKPNLGGSYTSWSHGLELDNGYSDLVFLIEDDYVIKDTESIDLIISDFQMESDLFYYCGLWRENHASISNGIINNKMYHQSELKFQTVDSILRQDLFNNQINFLEPFRNKLYKLKDYKSKYSSIFSNGVDTMIEYGVPNGKVIFHPLTITK